jgi:hypothetical protein
MSSCRNREREIKAKQKKLKMSFGIIHEIIFLFGCLALAWFHLFKWHKLKGEEIFDTE